MSCGTTLPKAMSGFFGVRGVKHRSSIKDTCGDSSLGVAAAERTLTSGVDRPDPGNFRSGVLRSSREVCTEPSVGVLGRGSGDFGRSKGEGIKRPVCAHHVPAGDLPSDVFLRGVSTKLTPLLSAGVTGLFFFSSPFHPTLPFFSDTIPLKLRSEGLCFELLSCSPLPGLPLGMIFDLSEFRESGCSVLVKGRCISTNGGSGLRCGCGCSTRTGRSPVTDSGLDGTSNVLMSKFLDGTSKFLDGTSKFLDGTSKFLGGTSKFLDGTSKFLDDYFCKPMHSCAARVSVMYRYFYCLAVPARTIPREDAGACVAAAADIGASGYHHPAAAPKHPNKPVQMTHIVSADEDLLLQKKLEVAPAEKRKRQPAHFVKLEVRDVKVTDLGVRIVQHCNSELGEKVQVSKQHAAACVPGFSATQRVQQRPCNTQGSGMSTRLSGDLSVADWIEGDGQALFVVKQFTRFSQDEKAIVTFERRVGRYITPPCKTKSSPYTVSSFSITLQRTVQADLVVFLRKAKDQRYRQLRVGDRDREIVT
ncbi:hypothetical protein B566_EDAN016255 [Ephemera danica]|nr:hypothetical protein B566_EDAN016255 [Ephemera danica]